MTAFDWPRLDNAPIIAVDCETRDDNLRELGMGAVRDGYIAGVAIGTPDKQFYLPIRHEGGGNLPEENVKRYLNDTLSTATPKTGANLQYDLAYLWSEGIRIQGPFWDIQIAEPLLDENKGSYALQTLAMQYLGVGKNDAAMEAYIREHFGVKPGKEKSYIWKCPAEVVAPYACEDVRLPIEIIQRQLPELARQGLEEVWTIEQELLPILVQMHLRGVRVDHERAQQLEHDWRREMQQLEDQLQGINPKSSKQLAEYLLAQGIVPPKTAKGNYSVTSKWVESLENPPPLIVARNKVSKYRTFLDTFVNAVHKHAWCGRIHGQYNQLRGDEYGTVTGRLSASMPNLQNVPNPEKDPYFSTALRGLYLPEQGEEWLRFDFSQIEYRLMVHFAATLPGQVAARPLAMYHANPLTDFHQMCADLTGLSRKKAKNINFGLLYGMGNALLASSLGVSLDEAREISDTYHKEAPAARAFTSAAMQRAANRGYVKTISGRRRRFESWEPARFVSKKEREAGDEVWVMKDKQAAIDKWGAVKRGHTHAAGNAVLQGSSADMTKKAMVEGYKRGIYDVLGYPLVTVHDELGFSIQSVNPAHEEAAKAMREIMEQSYPLKVPVVVSAGRGKSWGAAG